MKYIIIAAALFVFSDSAYADAVDVDPRIVELRYCGEPKRNAKGVIMRSVKVRKAFEKMYPLPEGISRDTMEVDHVLPLERGGCDSIINMQWLPKSIKRCPGNACKDRWERIIYPKSY